MPLSSDKGARGRQLKNLRRGPVSHGTGSERRLKPVRERHAQTLRSDYPYLDDRRLVLLADTLARVELAVAWLDRRGGVVQGHSGEAFPVVRDLHRWSSHAWRMLSGVEQAKPPKPVSSVHDALGEIAEIERRRKASDE